MKTTLRKMFWALLSLIALPVSAYDFEVDGIYYDITSLSEFTCAVTTGEVPYEGTFVIPATVEYNNRTLTVTGINGMGTNAIHSLSIPNTVLSVSDNAFYNSRSLDSLIIQDGDTEIDLGRSSSNPVAGWRTAFYYTPVSYAYIGRNIKKVSTLSTSFGGSSIKVAEIGEQVTSMPSFGGSEQLERVIIGKGVIVIGDESFSECRSLTDISMSDNVVEIGKKAFSGCRSLLTISLPPNLEKIGDDAFNKSALQSIDLPESVKEIGRFCFAGCEGLSSIELPDAITKLPYRTFINCFGLKSIKLPKSLVDIDNEVFYDCSSLTEIVIPNLVESIGNSMFKGCKSLKSVTFGESLKTIPSSAFDVYDCFEVINVLATTPPKWDSPKFSTAQYMTLPVNVPIGTKEAYMQADVWKNFWNINEVLPNSIGTVSTDSQEDANAIYTINGVKHNTTNLSDLPSGIYIKNGKKVYVK